MNIEEIIRKVTNQEQLTTGELDEINEWLNVPFIPKQEDNRHSLAVLPVPELLGRFMVARTLIILSNTKPEDLADRVMLLRVG